MPSRLEDAWSWRRFWVCLNFGSGLTAWLGFATLIPILPLILSGRAFCYGAPPVFVACAWLGTSGAAGWAISCIGARNWKTILFGLIPSIFWLPRVVHFIFWK